MSQSGRLSTGALLAAVAVSAPAWWQSLQGRLPVDVAALRFLVGLVAAAIGASVLDAVVGAYRAANDRASQASATTTDQAGPTDSPPDRRARPAAPEATD